MNLPEQREALIQLLTEIVMAVPDEGVSPLSQDVKRLLNAIPVLSNEEWQKHDALKSLVSMGHTPTQSLAYEALDNKLKAFVLHQEQTRPHVGDKSQVLTQMDSIIARALSKVRQEPPAGSKEWTRPPGKRRRSEAIMDKDIMQELRELAPVRLVQHYSSWKREEEKKKDDDDFLSILSGWAAAALEALRGEEEKKEEEPEVPERRAEPGFSNDLVMEVLEHLVMYGIKVSTNPDEKVGAIIVVSIPDSPQELEVAHAILAAKRTRTPTFFCDPYSKQIKRGEVRKVKVDEWAPADIPWGE